MNIWKFFFMILRNIYYLLPLKIRLKIKFIKRLGYYPDFNNPKTFNEKINFFKLNSWNDLHVRCSDKLKVRDYVSDKGLAFLLNDIYVFDSIDELVLKEILIKFDDIFVKANHNSGPVFRLKNTSTQEEINKAVVEISRQLNSPYGYYNGELWYDSIQPKSFCEKTLIQKDGSIPPDYKFHVFDYGKGDIFLQYDYDRFSEHGRTLFDENLTMLKFSIQYKNKFRRITRPLNYKEMVSYARKLASDFK